MPPAALPEDPSFLTGTHIRVAYSAEPVSYRGFHPLRHRSSMTIHPHSSLEALAQALAAETARLKAQAEADPFQPIPVISPSKQFTDWIQVEIARQHGLCMGLEFLAIGGFLER